MSFTKLCPQNGAVDASTPSYGNWIGWDLLFLFHLKSTCMRTSPVPILGTGCTFFFSTAILFVFSANMFKKARGKKGHYSLHCSGPGERMSWWSSLILRIKVFIFSLQVHWTVKWITAKYIFDAFCLFIMCWQVVLIVYLARVLLIF